MQTIKERAKAAVKAWEDAGHADATETLAAVELLREIANAPEPEPVGYLFQFNNGNSKFVDGKAEADWISHHLEEAETCTELYPAPQPLSVPDAWRSAIAKEFPLYDEDGLDEDKHCCEWVVLQERKRLRKILDSAIATEKGGEA